MLRRSALLVSILLAALAFLAPLAALADSCTDCLWGASAKCCPGSSCSCCLHVSSALTASAWGDFGSLRTGLALSPAAGGCLSMSPRDVFHVPKASV